MADTELDLTEDWLKLRQRSVVLRRQCKQREGFERRVVEEDKRPAGWRRIECSATSS